MNSVTLNNIKQGDMMIIIIGLRCDISLIRHRNTKYCPDS